MQSGTTFRLIVRRGPQPNQQHELVRDTITLGRDITNDLVINDPEVSRHHMRLIRTPSGYTIEDLRSTNGTFVNKQRLTAPYQLVNGDLIGLGETVTLEYQAGGAGDMAATVASGARPMAGQPQAAPPASPACPRAAAAPPRSATGSATTATRRSTRAACAPRASTTLTRPTTAARAAPRCSPPGSPSTTSAIPS